jgi:uncharacterized membrane protein YkoI
MSTNMTIKKVMTSILLTLFILCPHGLAAAPKNIISKQQAIAVVKDNFGGKVLKAKLLESPSGRFYSVKLLTKKGRVKQVSVDSRTGDILNNR